MCTSSVHLFLDTIPTLKADESLGVNFLLDLLVDFIQRQAKQIIFAKLADYVLVDFSFPFRIHIHKNFCQPVLQGLCEHGESGNIFNTVYIQGSDTSNIYG